MRIIVLGCGSSRGVPMIGCDCSVCVSTSPYNNRTRSSILIENDIGSILIDTGYEVRQQLIRHNIKMIDAVILTHCHSDQVSGIDDIQVFSFRAKKIMPIYSDAQTLSFIMDKYNYLFRPHDRVGQFFSGHEIGFADRLELCDMNIQCFRVIHGNINNIAIKIGNFVYSNDVHLFPEESEQFLYNVDHWIVDCVDYSSHWSHAGLDSVLQWKEKYKPKNLYLTNMAHSLDYHKLIQELPNDVIPLYDGYIIQI